MFLCIKYSVLISLVFRVVLNIALYVLRIVSIKALIKRRTPAPPFGRKLRILVFSRQQGFRAK